MAEAAAHRDQPLSTRQNEPLIGIPLSNGPEEVVQYFASEEAADQAVAADRSGVERVLSLIGAWEHFDTEDGPDMLDELDRLRHASPPSPPLDL
jgi:hypothetical protein